MYDSEVLLPSAAGEAPNPPSRFCLASLADINYDEERRISFMQFWHYCRRHDYGFVYSLQNIDRARPPSWSKIPLVLRAMERYEWVWWADADVLITNPSITLESIVADAESAVPGVEFIIARDRIPQSRMNCGSWLMRSCDASRKFLQKVWDHYPHDAGFWEQGACNEMYDAGDWPIKAYWIDRLRIQSFPAEWCEGDFNCHFAGTKDRALKMSQLVRELKLDHSVS